MLNKRDSWFTDSGCNSGYQASSLARAVIWELVWEGELGEPGCVVRQAGGQAGVVLVQGAWAGQSHIYNVIMWSSHLWQPPLTLSACPFCWGRWLWSGKRGGQPSQRTSFKTWSHNVIANWSIFRPGRYIPEQLLGFLSMMSISLDSHFLHP